MTANGWLQLALYLAVLIGLAKPLGAFMARVYEGEPHFLARWLGCPFVILGPAWLAAALSRGATDLWSVRSNVFELAGGAPAGLATVAQASAELTWEQSPDDRHAGRRCDRHAGLVAPQGGLQESNLVH